MYSLWKIVLGISLCHVPLLATCCGRIDIGPAFANIDMLESGITKRSLDLSGVRADMSYRIYEGLCIKPSFLIMEDDARLNSVSLGIGYCIPCTPILTVTPSIGVTETHFKGRIDFPKLGLFRLKEKFVSRGFYGSLDLTWSFDQKTRLYTVFQYAWSRVHTTIHPIYKSKDQSEGPVYSAVIERDICEYLSINLGATYNLSLNKDKFGIRGKGVKLGLAYWF